MSNCPTCKRRPSERHGLPGIRATMDCKNPCHDLADRAPEMRDVLVELRTSFEIVGDGTNKHSAMAARLYGVVGAFLASLPQPEVTP